MSSEDRGARESTDSGCTLPPDHPLPADELGRYSPNRDYFAEQDITQYVEGQARDEKVLNAEKIKTEHVLGTHYDLWDVVTDKSRWWVITNPTNLYSQSHFPSLDYTLSFHIGLMMRVQAREDRDARLGSTPFDEVMVRLADAEDLLADAEEVVEFQAVGMQLREALISLVLVLQTHLDFGDQVERPRAADVVGWSTLINDRLCPGPPNKELRQYFKSMTERTWQLVNWLTHYRDATETTGRVCLDATGTLVSQYAHLLTKGRRDRTEACPRCRSRKLRTFYDPEMGEEGDYFESCAACGWNSHPGLPDIGEEPSAR